MKEKYDASQLKDYRPISLIHSFSKLFTKVLENHLAPAMHGLTRLNQSSFIKGRVLHDNFRDVHLTAKALHRKHKPSILIKLDIAKAFDTVSWSFLLDILKHMGFSDRWLNWISLLLSTASTKVVVNGSPGRRICHARGLRQGDPLSPLLFVLAMKALNCLLRYADREGFLRALGDANIQERSYLYADDVVLFFTPNQQDLIMTQSILQIFSLASGLTINPDKCLLSLIQCHADSMQPQRHSMHHAFLPRSPSPFSLQISRNPTITW